MLGYKVVVQVLSNRIKKYHNRIGYIWQMDRDGTYSVRFPDVEFRNYDWFNPVELKELPDKAVCDNCQRVVDKSELEVVSTSDRNYCEECVAKLFRYCKCGTKIYYEYLHCPECQNKLNYSIIYEDLSWWMVTSSGRVSLHYFDSDSDPESIRAELDKIIDLVLESRQ